MYIWTMLKSDPYKSLSIAKKEMKDIKKVMMQMREENISIEEILGQ